MKNRLIKYLEAAHRRSEASIHKRWQRIRRIGQRWFILLAISGYWLLMAVGCFYAAWTIRPSIEALRRLPPHFYQQLIAYVLICNIPLYLGARYAWRENERKYTNDRNA